MAPDLHPSSTAPTLVFDVSSIMEGDHTRPTGIHRVAFEVAVQLIDLTGGAVEFTRFDRDLQRYRQVEQRALLERIDTFSTHATAITVGPVADVLPGCVERSLKRAVAGVSRHAPSTARQLKKALAHARRAGMALAAAFGATRADTRRSRQRRRIACHSERWTSATTYVSLGADFAHNDLDHLRARKLATGARLALAMYDLIPVSEPQFATRDLDDFYAALVGVADVLFVISEHVRADLAAFVERLGVRSPRVERLTLSSSLIDSTPARPAVLPLDVEQRGYVLFVSTITLRKNHALLLDVWSRWISERSIDEVPSLLFVGASGSLSDETVSRLHRDPSLCGRVVQLAGLSDPEVAWLYQHAAFTVYPSLSEGWGLPVTESHDFGKVCVASDRTSLPEAGEGLAVHLDPLDRGAWLHTLRDLWDRPAQREAIEVEIARRHRRVTPRDTAMELLAALERIG